MGLPCCLGWLLLYSAVLSEPQESQLPQYYKEADSLLSRLLARPETRMKEIAPAESLFHQTLAKHSEVFFIVRTNSKGVVVNAVSRNEDSTMHPGMDAAGNKWHSAPEKNQKRYHGPVLPAGGKGKPAVVCSVPIIVKNSIGVLRFGGVLAIGVFSNQASAIVPVSKREKARTSSVDTLSGLTAQKPKAKDTASGGKVSSASAPASFPDTLHGKMAQSVKEKDPLVSSQAASKSPIASPEDTCSGEALRKMDAAADDSAVSTLVAPHEAASTASFDSSVSGSGETPRAPNPRIANESSSVATSGDSHGIPWALPVSGAAAFVLIAFAFVLRGKKWLQHRAGDKGQEAELSMLGGAISSDEFSSLPIQTDENSPMESAKDSSPLQHEVPAMSIHEALIHDETIALHDSGGSQVFNLEPDGEKADAGTHGEASEPPYSSTNESAVEWDGELPTAQSGGGENADEEQHRRNEIRARLASDMKNEIMENEINGIRNSVIAELKAEIRQKLEKNESEAIRSHLRQELAEAWRSEIEQNYREPFYRQEIENLRKIVRQKLVEKEMPLLVNSFRDELSKEIRQKMVATYYDQIERHERNVMKAEIIKRLQTDEYPQLFQEEREKLRNSIERQLSEKESEPIAALLREDLTNRLRAGIQTEEESLRNDIRREMAARVEGELMEREYDDVVRDIRNGLKERTMAEIAERELNTIHEDLVAQITNDERERIHAEELGQIIETERRRIAEQEAPMLREQVRQQLREQELDAMRSLVKKEIYSETTQSIREACEIEFKDLLEKKIVEYREFIEKKLQSEMKKNILDEYHTLTDDLERLAGSVGNVEALESLEHTITLLSDEKKKYKYFNLNSAQTESLLEYLKRVQSRFNIFLDKIDESLREMELKIRSVMNKLDSGA
jgi:hypothetical protein